MFWLFWILSLSKPRKQQLKNNWVCCNCKNQGKEWERTNEGRKEAVGGGGAFVITINPWQNLDWKTPIKHNIFFHSFGNAFTHAFSLFQTLKSQSNQMHKIYGFFLKHFLNAIKNTGVCFSAKFIELVFYRFKCSMF